MTERPTPPDPEKFKVHNIQKQDFLDKKESLEYQIRMTQRKISLIENPPVDDSNKFIKIIGIALLLGIPFLMGSEGIFDFIILGPLAWFFIGSVVMVYFGGVAFMEKKRINFSLIYLASPIDLAKYRGIKTK